MSCRFEDAICICGFEFLDHPIAPYVVVSLLVFSISIWGEEGMG